MKELEYPYEKCPHCGCDIKDVLKDWEKNLVETADVEKVEDNKYGVQARWKEVFTCPDCGKKFFIICEH